MTNITTVSVTFGHGIKREEYGPVKKAEASITASVAEDEDGEAVLARIGELALAQVAALLDAPKPDVALSGRLSQAANTADTKDAAAAKEPEPAGEAPPRRGRGRPKKEDAASEATLEATSESSSGDTGETISTSTTATTNASPSDDEWEVGSEDIQISDQELLSATSKRAGELGAREPIVKLIATFATRTEGAPFKVQEIPQAQRKDYLSKLAALTA